MKILESKIIAPNVHQMTLAAPNIAKRALAGQFAIAIPNEFSERTPVTLSDWNAEKGTVTVVFLEIGAATRALASLKKGDKIYSFTGPLGKPFEIKNFGKVGLIGGCYGIGGILQAAKALRRAGNEVISFPEARSGFLLYWNEKLEEVSDQVRYSTSDGSLGSKGHSHDLLEKNLTEGEKFDRIMAIGCTFMMFRIAQVTRPFKVKTIVSMNPIMIDGTGMCGACRLSVAGKTRFACVDGPHFDAHEVDWDVVLNRRKAYLEEEIVSTERSTWQRSLEHKHR
jgi:ferredoxin--NADP+ reductase